MSARPRVLVVPTGGANLASLVDALERLGAHCEVSAEPTAWDRADRLVLPGVGAAPEAHRRLVATGQLERLRAAAKPVLGVCLGLQLLFERSAEGETPGVGVLAGGVDRLVAGPGVAVPHMGWNRVRRLAASRLLEGIDDGAFFYFAHSFAAAPQGDTVADCEHGARFAAVVERGAFHGVQFHPERSSAAGARLLANFLELPACS